MAKQRSPNYPGADLEMSLSDVTKVYDREKTAPFTPEVASKAWGYRSLSGPARVRVAALRQYGLLEQRKGQEAKVSNRALTLILRNRSTAEYQQALRDAALEPPLFQELARTRLSSSDDSLKHYLIVNKGFTDDGAKRVIEVFRNTMALAGITESAIISGQDEGESLDEGTSDADPGDLLSTVENLLNQPKVEMQQRNIKPPAQGEHRTFTIPLPDDELAAIQIPRPMSESAWAQMIAVLTAMKPGLVERDEPKPRNAEQATQGKLTEAARELIQSADSGVPAFMNRNIEKIAEENGIHVTPENTPNDIIEALRMLDA